MNRTGYLDIVLKPVWKDDTVCRMELVFLAPAAVLKNTEAAITFPKEGFGGLCPFPDYSDLKVSDEKGKIPYAIVDAPSFNTAIPMQGIHLEREAVGEVRWSYTIYPRVLPEGYRSSPYYDFRSEPYGLNGSGLFSFMLPRTQEKLQVRLSWDLSRMPEGARGIWSYGEGRVERTMTPLETAFSLYDTGLVHAVESPDFGVFWHGDPGFDAASVAGRVLPIFEYEKHYFHDEKAMFRVFLRRDPFRQSGGGSACRYAFISGYSAFGGTDPDAWFNVLIHEMTHTWPCMDDSRVGEGTWFTEGCTEYYCTMLPYEGGFLDADFTVRMINEKAGTRYYRNPYRSVPNAEIPKIQWKERQAQTVPYGRGFLYLANVNAKLRRLGKGSIDDIVLTHGWDNPLTLELWERFVQERLGTEGVEDFHAMQSGALLVPEPDLFGRDFIAVEESVSLNGQSVPSWHWEVRK